MREGQKIYFRGEGDQQPGLEPGDVIIVLQLKYHEKFQRSGDDLVMTHTLSLTEALCGFSLVVKHLDGRDLLVNHPTGQIVKPGTIKGIAGEGMPHYKNPFEKGNLYIKFDVTFPDNHFTSETKLQELESILPPRPQVTLPPLEDLEEVDLQEYDPNERRNDGARGEAYDDDEMPFAGPGVQCTHQ
uniref:Chaperone DnaJ C-terminal domain-containing protein n=1 Tax=Homalodisca liturata TaxID=320908 RepID=A0A1B6JQ81_9HEMI